MYTVYTIYVHIYILYYTLLIPARTYFPDILWTYFMSVYLFGFSALNTPFSPSVIRDFCQKGARYIIYIMCRGRVKRKFPLPKTKKKPPTRPGSVTMVIPVAPCITGVLVTDTPQDKQWRRLAFYGMLCVCIVPNFNRTYTHVIIAHTKRPPISIRFRTCPHD